MIRHQRIKQTIAITALSLILILWLAFPGYAEDGEQGNESISKQIDVFKLDPMSFRLAPRQQNDPTIFSLLSITDNLYSLNQKNTSQHMEDKNPPAILEGQPKKSGQLGNSLFTASLLTLTALNIADYVTTVKALKLPGLEEGNPVMHPFTKNMLVFSAVKLGIYALDFYLLKNIYKKSKPLGWILSIAANLTISYVVSHNIRKIQAVSGK